MFIKNEKCLVTDTSFGMVVLEKKVMKPDFETALIEMQTILIGEIFKQRNDLEVIKQQLERILPHNFGIPSNDTNIILTMFMGYGWYINGVYIGLKAFDDISELDELFDYILVDRANVINNISLYHRLILIELLSNYYPELILKKQSAFESLKNGKI